MKWAWALFKAHCKLDGVATCMKDFHPHWNVETLSNPIMFVMRLRQLPVSESLMMV